MFITILRELASFLILKQALSKILLTLSIGQFHITFTDLVHSNCTVMLLPIIELWIMRFSLSGMFFLCSFSWPTVICSLNIKS